MSVLRSLQSNRSHSKSNDSSLWLGTPSRDGTEFRSRNSALAFSNPIKLGRLGQLTPGVELELASFGDRREGPRFDRTLTAVTSWGVPLGGPWSALADLQYQANFSTLTDTYQYFRWIASAGVACSI